MSNGTVNVRPEDVTDINGRVWFTDNDGFLVVFQGFDTPLYRVALNDEVQMRFVAVHLRLGGLARQEEIARAFGHSVETQRRWERRFEAEGLEGLRRKKARGAPIKITTTQEAYIRKWYEAGEKNREVARRLGVSEATVRNALKRMGLHRDTDKTASLPIPEPEEETQEEQAETTETPCPTAEVHPDDEASMEVSKPGPSSFMDPLDRSLDRIFARMGLLDDAEPVFANVEGLPRAGIFLAIPLLVQSGMLPIFSHLYGSIGPAFYGLRTSVVCLFMLALLRIKRPETLKEHDPQDLGRLLGLDRAPEVKTLRRKLAAMAGRGKGVELMFALAKRRCRDREEAIGVLYADGHVKEYHGKKKVGKGYITQRRLAVPAVTDTWVNDVEGDPLFVVSSQMNAGLTKMLEPVLEEVKKVVGEGRKITIVFDRGGWSPKLFYKIINAGFDIITYRKGHDPRIPVDAFKKVILNEKGKEYKYKLNDRTRVRIGKTDLKKKEKGPKYVWMRQVTRLREDNHQTPVITTREDLPPEKVLYLMFNRWRQENFFKYMLEEFALDAMLEYGDEPVVEQEDRPNPEVREIDKDLRKERVRLAKVECELGKELRDNEEAKRPTVRGFKIAHAKLLEKAEKIRNKIEQLKARKARLPKRVPVSDLVSLKKERKLICDSIKMTAYQIESDLTRMLGESYKRNADEGRTLLHAMFQSRGDIEVKDGELRVTLAPQSSPHRTRAVQVLCEKLTQLGKKFPGTNLRLSLTVAEPVNIS